jgi:hypothetical protein
VQQDKGPVIGFLKQLEILFIVLGLQVEEILMYLNTIMKPKSPSVTHHLSDKAKTGGQSMKKGFAAQLCCIFVVGCCCASTLLCNCDMVSKMHPEGIQISMDRSSEVLGHLQRTLMSKSHHIRDSNTFFV